MSSTGKPHLLSSVLEVLGYTDHICSVLNPNNTSIPPDTNLADAVAPPAYSGASSVADVPFTSGVPEPSTTLTLPAAATMCAGAVTGTATSAAIFTGGAARLVSTGMGFVGAGALLAGAMMVLKW